MPDLGRKIAVGGVALATALLGLEAIGGVSITPGERTGFDWSVAPGDSSVIHLRSDAGNLSTWIDLTVQASPGPDIQWTATLPGRPLNVRSSSLGPNVWRVEISRTDSAAQEQFSWRSGQTIELSAAGAQRQLITDWTLHTEKGRDTQRFALWRTIWFYILLVSTVVGIVWAVVTALEKEKPPPALLVEEQAIATVKDVIAAIEGKSAEETQSIRKVLKAIALDRTDPATAVANTLPDDATWSQKYALQRRTSILFTKRMDDLILLLYKFRQSARPR